MSFTTLRCRRFRQHNSSFRHEAFSHAGLHGALHEAADRTGLMRHVAAPWSTCALWRLGSEILREQDPNYREAKDEKNRKVCDWQ